MSTNNIRDAVFEDSGLNVSEGLSFVYSTSEKRATVSLDVATNTTLGGVKVADTNLTRLRACRKHKQTKRFLQLSQNL